MKNIVFICISLILINLNALEVELEGRDELCMKFTMVEAMGSINIDALSTGFNSKLVHYRVYNENNELIKEQKKMEEFHHTENNTKAGEVFKFCIKDLDGTKKTIFFNKHENFVQINKPIQKDSFEGVRTLLQELLQLLRKIEQGIMFRESLASNHIELTEKNLNNIKYGSLAKVVIVGMITVIEIFILMKFIEKKDRVYPR